MVYFCSDDYGISKEYNRCIEECLEKGVLNKVSVMPNGVIDDFVQRLSRKGEMHPAKEDGQDPVGRKSQEAECVQIFHISKSCNGRKGFHRGRDLAQDQPLHPGRRRICYD